MKIKNLIDKTDLLSNLLADKVKNIFDGAEANKYNKVLDEITTYILKYPSIIEEYKEELKVIKNMVFHSLYASALNEIISKNAFIKLNQDINAKFENYINNIETLETTKKGDFDLWILGYMFWLSAWAFSWQVLSLL